MKRRQWNAKEKLQIVLEGLSGKSSVSEICTRHNVGQSQYYKWRDQFLANGARVFEQTPEKAVEHLKRQLKARDTLIGQLTVELKKTELDLERL